MNVFVYSDESGVFDKFHNDFFVFGGLMFLSKDDRDVWRRKYIAAEKSVRSSEKMRTDIEVKATTISNKSKSKLYRSLNQAEKFGVVVKQKKLLDSLFDNKKGKQRYLDWAYKMSVKTKFLELIRNGQIVADNITGIYFFVDEHTTATNGIYELQESLEQEFKYGTYNYDWMTFHPPIFPNLQIVKVEYCNSSTKTLVRAADIVANHIYHEATENSGVVQNSNKLVLYYHP